MIGFKHPSRWINRNVTGHAKRAADTTKGDVKYRYNLVITYP